MSVSSVMNRSSSSQSAYTNFAENDDCVYQMPVDNGPFDSYQMSGGLYGSQGTIPMFSEPFSHPALAARPLQRQASDLRTEVMMRTVETPDLKDSSLARATNLGSVLTPRESSASQLEWSQSPARDIRGPALTPRTEESRSLTPSRPSKRGQALSRVEKKALIAICNNRAAEYRDQNIGKFWIKIKEDLKDETGRLYASCRQTVERWIATDNAMVAEEELESGTAEEMNDFRVAVQAFKERVEYVNNRKTTQQQKKSDKQKRRAADAEEARELMLADMDDDDEEYEANQKRAGVALSSKAKRQKRSDDAKAASAETLVKGMKSACEAIGDSIVEAAAAGARKSAPTPTNAQEYNALEQRINKIEEKMDARHSELTDLLRSLASAR